MNQEIISRYIGQPASLPSDLRAALQRAWNGQPVQLYALADLDHTLKLQQQWLALGATHVAVARAAPDGAWEIESIERSRIRAVAHLSARSGGRPPPRRFHRSGLGAGGGPARARAPVAQTVTSPHLSGG